MKRDGGVETPPLKDGRERFWDKAEGRKEKRRRGDAAAQGREGTLLG